MRKCLKMIYVPCGGAAPRLETAGVSDGMHDHVALRMNLAAEDECCPIGPHCARLIIPVTSVTSTAP